jgi:hypothetical protein
MWVLLDKTSPFMVVVPRNKPPMHLMEEELDVPMAVAATQGLVEEEAPLICDLEAHPCQIE